MKKSIISLAIAAGLVASMPAAHAGDVKVKWFGFAQITSDVGDGSDIKADRLNSADEADGGIVFGADRVRFGFKLKDGNIFGKLQADLAQDGKDGNGIPNTIKDIEAGYKFSDAASLKAGQFKSPVGMDFNLSGKKLDITKRGMEKGLVLERATGAMLSGRKIANGIGYDLFYGDIAVRSKATSSKVNTAGSRGKDHSYAARIMYDMGKMMHVEASYGVNENSSTAISEDYNVFDLGFGMRMAAMTIKAEYIAGSNVGGLKDSDETAYFVHFGYNLGKTTELLVRHYQADSDKPAAGGATDSTSLSNTYLGANFFLGSNKTNGRIQLNYVIAGGDTYDAANNGKQYKGQAANGYHDDTFLAQYQISF